MAALAEALTSTLQSKNAQLRARGWPGLCVEISGNHMQVCMLRNTFCWLDLSLYCWSIWKWQHMPVVIFTGIIKRINETESLTHHIYERIPTFHFLFTLFFPLYVSAVAEECRWGTNYGNSTLSCSQWLKFKWRSEGFRRQSNRFHQWFWFLSFYGAPGPSEKCSMNTQYSFFMCPKFIKTVSETLENFAQTCCNISCMGNVPFIYLLFNWDRFSATLLHSDLHHFPTVIWKVGHPRQGERYTLSSLKTLLFKTQFENGCRNLIRNFH